MKKMTLPFSLILLALASPTYAAHHDDREHREHGTHVHGEGKLTLAVIDQQIEITLDSPAETLFGFEHAPETDAEKSAVDAVLEKLNAPEKLFHFGADSGCKLNAKKIESPFVESGKQSLREHADIEAQYTFTCTHAKNIQKVDVRLLSLFPKLHKLTMDYITDKAQGSVQLDADHRQWTLP